MAHTITDTLFRLQDTAYRDFQAKLLPGIDASVIIGVRTPQLRALAKQLTKSGGSETELFLQALPHHYFDENQLHAFILSEEKDFSACIEKLNAFLPHIDNWATCDQLSPRVFKKQREALLPCIRQWLGAEKPFTVRFAIGMLMQHFLDDDFSPVYLREVAAIHSEAYYINMMRAWYFATALAKQYEATIPLIQQKELDPWTHNKTIQKAVESYRISAEQKAYLKTLKIPSARSARRQS